MDIRDRCEALRKSLPIRHVIEGWYGHDLSKAGRGTCPFCEGSNNTKFRIVDDTGFICASCKKSGDVIKFISFKEGLNSVEEAVLFAEEKMGVDPPDNKKRAQRRNTPRRMRDSNLKEQVRYQYLNEDGTEAYEIIRFWDTEKEKKVLKPFRNGRFGLSTDERLLYHLNEVVNITDQTIYIVEGEKCADAMKSIGYVATTNPFGCGEWKPEFGYGDYLEGRSICIIPDADDEGQHWLDAVVSDLRGRVQSIRVLSIPKTWVKKHRQFKGHDVADYLEVEGADKTKEMIEKAEKKADIMIRGFEVGITCTPKEAYTKYVELMEAGNFNVMDFSKWVPSYEMKSRRGDLVCFLAGTKVGKSRLLMNSMYFIDDVTYLVFDLELSRETVGERWCALHNGVSVEHVQKAIEMGHPYDMPDLDHIRMANCGGKGIDFIRERIDAEEQIISRAVDVVVIDYIGLMKGRGKGKTEILSSIVEDFKGTMTDLGKVGLISSQRVRPTDKEEGLFRCPSIFDNKDSSAIENSAQLSIGFWKLQDRPNHLGSQVLAYSHGNCNQDPVLLKVNELRITEQEGA